MVKMNMCNSKVGLMILYVIYIGILIGLGMFILMGMGVSGNLVIGKFGMGGMNLLIYYYYG